MHFLKMFSYIFIGVGILVLDLSPERESSQRSFPGPSVPEVTFGKKDKSIVEPVYQMGSILQKHVNRLRVNEARAAVGDSEGDTTYYPTALFSRLKQFMDPLPDSNACDSAGEGSAMIASVNCHLTQDIGVEGIGNYTNDMDGGTFTVNVSDASNAGYDYLVEAWVDFGSKLKFMNYWLDGGGQRGKMEIFPQLPGNNSNTFALYIEWDSTDLTNQSLTVIMEQLASAGNSWTGRQMAMKLSGSRNDNTGNVELNGGVNQACSSCQVGGSFDAFKVQMVRNDTHTIAQGEICDGEKGGSTDEVDCSSSTTGAYVCFKNSDKVIVETDNSSFPNILINECNDLVAPSGSQIEVDKASAGLFHDSDDDIFTLDTSD